MGLNRQDKAAVIEEVAGIVANSSSIVIAEYRGLSVEAVTKLRGGQNRQFLLGETGFFPVHRRTVQPLGKP